MGMLDALLGYSILRDALKAGAGITLTDLGPTTQQIQVDATPTVTGVNEALHKTYTGTGTSESDAWKDILTVPLPVSSAFLVVAHVVGIDMADNKTIGMWQASGYTDSYGGVYISQGEVFLPNIDSSGAVQFASPETGDAIVVQAHGDADVECAWSVRAVVDIVQSPAV